MTSDLAFLTNNLGVPAGLDELPFSFDALFHRSQREVPSPIHFMLSLIQQVPKRNRSSPRGKNFLKYSIPLCPFRVSDHIAAIFVGVFFV